MGIEIIKLSAGILELRKGFKVVEDQDTRDTYGEDDEDNDEDSEGSDDSAWDEYEVGRADLWLTQRTSWKMRTSRLCTTLLWRNRARSWS